jgi:adenylosuccinate synthase
MASPAQQLAVAGKLFEEAGVKLVPLFQNGAKGLTAMTKRAERLGITLEGVDFTAFERMKDALDDVYAIVVSIGARVAEKITPSIQAMVERIANVLTPANAEAFASTVAEYFSEAARVLLDAADYVIATVTPAIERISKSQEKSSSAFGDFAGFILNTVDGIRIVVKGATGIIQGLLGGFLKAITFPIRMMTELYAKLTGSQGGIVDWAGAVADGFSDGLLKGAGESFTSAGRVISNAADRLDASNRAAANSISQGIKRPDVTIDVDRKGLEQDRVARKALQASALKQQTQLAKSIERATARSAFYDYNTSAGRNEFHSLQRGDEFAKLAREQLEQQKKMVDLLSQPEPTVQLGY